MDENERLEELSMIIIANSGAARSLAYEALKYAKIKEFDKAEQTLVSSEETMKVAHKAHSQLLKADASGEIQKMNSLGIHAQCHIMSSIAVCELIKEMVELYKRIK